MIDTTSEEKPEAEADCSAPPCLVLEVDKIAFEGPDTPYRGYTIRASYLKEPRERDALVEIFKDGKVKRRFLFPAYKIWNLAAHLEDIVDGEIENSVSGYEMAAWDGLSGATVVMPNKTA